MRRLRVLRPLVAFATTTPRTPARLPTPAGLRPRLPAPARRAPGTGGHGALREEIQALRAVAVLLVVAYHLWPHAVPGGFVGVDVFFVISGFLITGMLLREVEASGRVGLGGFWARRARRLLPAALLTILACAVATLAFVPVTEWQAFFADLRASAAYVQNWHLASTSTDYFKSGDAPSPVQHFWSLSAEEQYYLVWPLLLLGAGLVAGGRARLSRRAVALLLGAVTVASLAFSVAYTGADPARAYFVTPTRAWEFGAGGLLALVPAAGAARGGIRAGLAWLGLAAIVLAALAYDRGTAFPGWAAVLPVAGALAVIRAATPERRLAPTRLYRLGPVQLTGDISYSIYLWHWPLLVLVPYAAGRENGNGTLVAILGATFVLAWLSKRFVEDPVRAWPRLVRGRARWSLAGAAAATLAVVGVTVGAAAHVQSRIDRDLAQSRRLLAEHPPCFGAAARDPRHPCENPRLRAVVAPTPLEAAQLPNAPCTMIERRSRLRVCAFGADPGPGHERVAVLGDSHASALRPALAHVARVRGWRGLSITRTGCPFTTATPDLREPQRSHCVQWNREVRAWFARSPQVHTVVVTARAGGDVAAPHGRSMLDAKADGYAAAWRALAPSVRHVIVVRDTPRMRGTTLDCVQDALEGGWRRGACAVPRDVALQADPQVVAARRVDAPRVSVVDLTPFLCDPRRCHAVVGGALAFKDADHLTPVFAQTLGPYLARQIGRVTRG